MFFCDILEGIWCVSLADTEHSVDLRAMNTMPEGKTHTDPNTLTYINHSPCLTECTKILNINSEAGFIISCEALVHILHAMHVTK